MQVLGQVSYLKYVSNETREELHYHLALENFENGARVISEGTECRELQIVINGQLEIYIGDGKPG